MKEVLKTVIRLFIYYICILLCIYFSPNPFFDRRKIVCYFSYKKLKNISCEKKILIKIHMNQSRIERRTISKCTLDQH